MFYTLKFNLNMHMKKQHSILLGKVCQPCQLDNLTCTTVVTTTTTCNLCRLHLEVQFAECWIAVPSVKCEVCVKGKLVLNFSPLCISLHCTVLWEVWSVCQGGNLPSLTRCQEGALQFPAKPFSQQTSDIWLIKWSNFIHLFVSGVCSISCTPFSLQISDIHLIK